MAEMATAEELALDTVMVCAWLVVLTVWLSKIKTEVEKLSPAESPVPESVTTGTLPRASLVMATPAVR